MVIGYACRRPLQIAARSLRSLSEVAKPRFGPVSEASGLRPLDRRQVLRPGFVAAFSERELAPVGVVGVLELVTLDAGKGEVIGLKGKTDEGRSRVPRSHRGRHPALVVIGQVAQDQKAVASVN